ncbi:hypothetical protein F5Y15DRAFT_430188 [Xylariaceae sp. FL0016]|nr:hypothetical protein F5Y15DRAFT_430188 [Xylariaceae sp. FL0016]
MPITMDPLNEDGAAQPPVGDMTVLRYKLEEMAAMALGISTRKLRNKSHRPWLALGGDSLMALSFVGACHEAGININIRNIFHSASLDNLLRQIVSETQYVQSSSKEDKPKNPSLEEPMSNDLREVLNGSVDQVQGVGPCSPMQENFIALQSLDPQAYQLKLAVKIESTTPQVIIDVDTVARCWKAVVQRHCALRTTFLESVDRPGRIDQVVWQEVSPQISILPFVDAQDVTKRGGYGSEFHHHLILAKTPDNAVFIRLVVSHALVDGVSIELIFRDLFRALAGDLPSGESMTCQDFFQAQRPDTSQEALDYWSQYTAGMESTFLQGGSLKDKDLGNTCIVEEEVSVPPELAEGALKDSTVTLANACQLAWALVLRSYTGNTNVSFSYTASGRQKHLRGIQDAVGTFVNTLPCRVDLTQSPNINSCLVRLQENFIDSLPFQGASLTNDRDEGGLSAQHFSDSLLSFQRGVSEEELALAGLAIDVVSWDAPSDYNYTMAISVNRYGLRLRLSTWESMTSQEDARNLIRLFRDSLVFVLRDARGSCSDFIGLTESDQARVLASNKEPYDIVRNCVHDQVWAMTAKQPNHEAVHAWDGAFTYLELDNFATRLAFSLLRLGLKSEGTVGVCMDKSRWAPVAMLAILKAGGIVVPLGHQYPPNRVRTITQSAGISILLADRSHAKRLDGIVPDVLMVDKDFLDELPSMSSAVLPRVSPDHAAWVVFTSGSTGKPKGVVLEHKTLCSPMHVQAARYNIGPSTRALQFSAHTFDVVVKDIFTTLSFGGCVCIPSETARLNDLGSAINAMKVNFATLTPTVASLLDPRDVPGLETIVSTGEALSAAILQPWLQHGVAKWFNGYGPSECSHVSTINGPIARADEASTIGLPAANRLWVVDPLDFNRLSPIGAVGELLIEGAIARGYLNDPDGTAAAFVIEPGFMKRLGLAAGRRMYRTGDLVRRSKDGKLEYLGRKDTQIKIRGQRVELGEVESRISRLLPRNPLVCVDVLHSDRGLSTLIAAVEMPDEAYSENALLCAPCRATDELRIMLQGALDRLLDELPLYMVPSHLVPFSRLPKNASAKLDRRAIREALVELTKNDLNQFKQNDAVPKVSSETGYRLREVWAEVFGRHAADIGDNDHFLQLGGDSVVAMRTVGVARKTGVMLSVADIVQNPRLGDLARVVDGYEQTAHKVAQEDASPFELWSGFLSASRTEQENRLAAVADQCSISPGQVEDVYPASPLQEGLMAMTSQYQGTYVAQQVFRIDAKIDMNQFKEAWAAVASVLAILRTRIVYTPDAGSVQVVIRDLPRWIFANDLDGFLKKDRDASFAYGTPLHRFATIDDRARGERYFAWTAHHSAYDGQTVSRTLKMVATVFEGGICDTVTPITRFVRTLGRHARDEGWARAKDYWTKELQDAQLVRFPETPSPSYRPFADGVFRYCFQPLCKTNAPIQGGSRVSVAILLRAAWALVVSGSTASDEAMLAIVLSGRDVPVFGIENMVAPTITTVPTRIRVDRSKAVVDFLSAVDTASKEMAPHTQFGLANIRREVPDLGHDFDPGHLFVVHFGTPPDDITSAATLGLERLTGERQNFEGYNLVVECSLDEKANDIVVETHFDTNVLTSARVTELMSRLEHITRELQRYNFPDAAIDSAQRSVTLGELDLITPSEKEKLLDWNRPVPPPLEITLDQLVAQQVAKSPHSLAVSSRGRDLTYADLDGAADRLAQLLVDVGVGPEVLVGVCMDKSEFAIVSMLAILRAGGGVVPLGVQYSDTRMQTLVDDAEISVVLVDLDQVKRFKNMVSYAIIVNSALLDSLPSRNNIGSAISRANPGNPAWMIFTSGSTGTPKGVVLEHRALCHGILAAGLKFYITPATRNFQFSAFTFDVSITDIFATLAYGGCVCMPSEKDRTDGMTAAMNDFGVTFAVLTPTVTSLLDPETMPASLDTIVFVGEAIKPAAVKPWVNRVKVFNGYGPAECSIYSVINGPIRRSEDASIIGSNVANRLWITHPRDYNSLAPIGTPGELLIEGYAAARYYLHDPVKTAESFVTDPGFVKSLNLGTGRRMYRTGDLVRQNPENGLFVCLGRLDAQIKIRGQRVEVGEIESHIVRLQPSIKYACVDLVSLVNVAEPMLLAAVEISADFDTHEDGIVAFDDTCLNLPTAISRPSPSLNTFLSKIRVDLSQILPLYMVPAHFIPMKLPVNASGKLDRRASRTILESLRREELGAFSADHRNPGEERVLNSTERQLRALWTQVLGLQDDEIGSPRDDFLQLGGDSVAAMRLVAAARTAPVPIQLGVRQILHNPRLVDMARVAEENKAVKVAKADPKPFELWPGFKHATTDQRQTWLADIAEQCHDLNSAEDILDIYPSTALQEGLMAITSKQSSAYVAQQVFRMGPDVDIPRLQRAWNTMSNKLAILRTRIVFTENGSLQIVVRKTPQWSYVEGLNSYLTQDQSYPFAYGTPLHRLASVQDGSSRYFVWTVHHAAYDGWTLSLAMRLLIQTYQGYDEKSLTVTPIPRFIRYLQQTNESATNSFWRRQLEDVQLTRFPPLPSMNYQPCASSLVQTHIVGFPENLRVHSHNTTARAIPLGVLLRVAWAATIALYTGNDEATINISLSGRDVPVQDIANVVAPTLTTVPVRIKLDKERTVNELLNSVDKQAKEMVPFAHVGLHRIRNIIPELGSDFDAGHLFIIQPAPTEEAGLEAIGLELESDMAGKAESRDFGGYALAVDCTVDANSVIVEMRYDSKVLSHPRAAALLSHFEHTIRQFETCDRETTLSKLDLFSPADAETIRNWNKNTPWTKETCIHDLIHNSVTQYSEAQALNSWDGQFTYTELQTAALRLAYHLANHHRVKPETTVGLCMEKSRWAIVSILAILMAGGAVVPLGNQQPVPRIATITQDAGLSIILTDSTHAQRLADLEGVSPRLLIVDAPRVEHLPVPPTGALIDRVKPANAAWVVYTSGSTGVPKGIVLEHQALCSSFAAHGPRVGFGPGTRAFQFSAYTFDNAIEDILSVLSYGGCVCVPSEDQRLNALADTIRSLGVNLVNITPTMASLLEPTDVPLVKTMLLGGETVSPAVVEQWLGRATVINTYGPAECSVDVACSAPMKQPSEAYTIGHPLGVNFWVVSSLDYNRLVPLGMPGELLVEGPHLGRGYINDAEKTKQSFIWDPSFVSKLGLSSGRRMYRTGDLVRQNVDGSLVHLGRIDTQIKIRGQRVETGDIESNIVRIQPHIRMACVDLVRPADVTGDPLLIAAIDVGGFGSNESDEQRISQQTVRQPTESLRDMMQSLRGELLSVLPRYMMPHFVPMTSLPHNASGKLDRSATRAILARVSRAQIAAFEDTSEGSDNRELSPVEEQLRRIWVRMLGCSSTIGASAHFVQLGGDSVTAMRIVAAAQGEGIRIGVADIFKNPRLCDLAQVAQDDSATRRFVQDPKPFELWDGFHETSARDQEQQLCDISARCGVAPQDVEDIYPATPLQEGLMAVTAEQPDAYFAQFQFRMHDVDIVRFTAAWDKLVGSLKILRTRIVYDTVRAISVQVVVNQNLTWGGGDNLQTYLAEDKKNEFAYGTPLHRLAIIKTTDRKTSYFVWTSHHSGYDGYQVALTLNMLTQLYRNGGDIQPIPPPSRFMKYLRQKEKDQIESFWKKQLEDAHLTQFPPLPHASYRPQANDSLRRRLQSGRQASRRVAPISTLLRVAWAMTVGSYTGNTEAISVVALAGRGIPVPDIGNMAMPTLTTVPARTCFHDRTQRVRDLLRSADRQTEEMQPYMHTGMQHIRAALPGFLGAQLDPGHLLIVQLTMGANEDANPLRLIGLEELRTTQADFSGYALAVQCSVHPDDTVDIEMLYDKVVLPNDMAESLLLQFEHMVKQLESQGEATIGELDLLKAADVEKIRSRNGSVMNVSPTRSCIHELVQKMVCQQPQAQAISAWDGDLTYTALSQAASCLAHYLISLGVGPEITVGVCMEKSLYAMVSMLAILQAGGVVVALGTQHPLSRIKTIASDASIRVTLVDKTQAQRLLGIVSQPTIVDGSSINKLSCYEDLPAVPTLTPDNAAWIIYTSGSTGNPKGVVLSHQALCTGIMSHGTLFGNNKYTRALQFASHTFGVVIEDLFTTLIFGGCTCIPSEEQRLDTSELTRYINDMGINFVNITSTTASMIDPAAVPGVRTVVLGGEAVRPAVAAMWVKHAKVLNAYGQSECSVESVIGAIEHERDATTIGFPIGGSAAWVVDASDYNRLVPIGTAGELLIQGPLLARGYLGDDEKTKACFVTDPHFLRRWKLLPGHGCRMYRTGDLVKQNLDGSLLYLGRSDSQLKIRGQRVEPGEIESHIVQSDADISHACVDVIRPHDVAASADPVLVAAIELKTPVMNGDVQDTDKSTSLIRAPAIEISTLVHRIRSSLLQNLPTYMVPNYIVPMSSRLPVNASGKLDRRAARIILTSLNREQLEVANRSSHKSESISTFVEAQLREAYAEILSRDLNDIGLDDHFIELGGDSVAAMHVVASCRQRGLTVSVRDILRQQTIAALAPLVRKVTPDVKSQHLTEPELLASSAVTDIQEWMLNYHIARPDVGMTYFALDAAKPLSDERMADACRRLLASIEILHTGFVRSSGSWKRVVLDPSVSGVQTHITEGTIDDWTTEFMGREASKPLKPGRPLAEITICTTLPEKQNGQHRILFRLSHAIWDGMCIPVLWSTLQELYETGQARTPTAFSDYVVQTEKHRTVESSKYWSNLLQGVTMTPIGHKAPQPDDYVYPAGVLGPKTMEISHGLPKNMTCANVIKAAWSIVLARHSHRRDIVFADLVSGRAGIDPSVSDALGCCSTPIPVRVRLDLHATYAELVQALQHQQLDSMPYETHGLHRIVRECTDWPAGTAATSWINHVPRRMAGSLDMGGTAYTLGQPGLQEEKKWTFSEARISWTQDAQGLEFHLVYAVDRVSEHVARRLYDELASTLGRILTCPDALIRDQLSMD